MEECTNKSGGTAEKKCWDECNSNAEYSIKRKRYEETSEGKWIEVLQQTGDGIETSALTLD